MIVTFINNSARSSILDGHLHRTVNMKDRSSLTSYVAGLWAVTRYKKAIR